MVLHFAADEIDKGPDLGKREVPSREDDVQRYAFVHDVFEQGLKPFGVDIVLDQKAGKVAYA